MVVRILMSVRDMEPVLGRLHLIQLKAFMLFMLSIVPKRIYSIGQ